MMDTPAIAASRFPPSFDGNPWSYGFALFGLTLISALCVAQLMLFWFESRAREAAAASPAVHTFPPVAAATWTPLSIHRWIMTGVLTTILFGALPDVLILFFWGEASVTTMDNLFLADRLLDGLTIFPFLTASLLSAWASQVIPQQLFGAATIALQRPRWWMIRERLKVVLFVLAIAVGVTIGKAYG